MTASIQQLSDSGQVSVRPIRPIRDDEDYEAALEEIAQLWGAEPGTPADDRLDVLVTLVEAYEADHYPIPAPDPIELILHVMEARGLTRRDLDGAGGSDSSTPGVRALEPIFKARMFAPVEA